MTKMIIRMTGEFYYFSIENILFETSCVVNRNYLEYESETRRFDEGDSCDVITVSVSIFFIKKVNYRFGKFSRQKKRGKVVKSVD